MSNEWMMKECQKRFMMEKWVVKEIGWDLWKYNIKDTGGKSRKKQEDPPEGMYKEVNDYTARDKAWS